MRKLTFFVLFFSQLSFAYSKKAKGLLWGSIYGDSFGGPYEFRPVKHHPLIKLNKKLNRKQLKKLAKSVKLIDYTLKPHPYGIWKKNAPNGSITDDTRHKVIFWKSYQKDKKLSRKALAETYIEYYQKGGLYKKWLKEIYYGSRYVLDPKHKDALPLEKMYGGIPTLLGQLVFLPISILYPDKPIAAYKKSFDMNYLDIGYAKDITSSIISSLSTALKKNAKLEDVLTSFEKVDPYHFQQAEYVNRIVVEKVKLARKLIQDAKGVPLKLFKILEENLKAKTWWEAEVSLVVAISFLELTKGEPLAGLALCREFGHDTDSYAQLIGAYLGALYGESIFPKDMKIVKQKVRAEFKTILKGFY